MTARTPHDLAQVRPTAELDHPIDRGPASGRPQRPRTRRKRPARKPRRGWSIWTKLATGLGAIVLLAAAGVTALVMLVSPSKLVRDELVRQIKAETGRDLTIAGRASFLFYPNIAVSLGKVALSGGETGSSMLTAESVDVSVALLPLLNKRVLIERVVLNRPIFDLHVDAAGRPNWEFSRSYGRSAPVRVAQLGAGLGSWQGVLDQGRRGEGRVHLASMPGAGAILQKLELRAVTLKKARIVYRDARTGTAEQLDDLDLQLNGRRLVDPLAVRGDALWRNERFSFAARVTTVAELLKGQTTKVRLTLSGSSLSAGFDGSIKTKDNVVTHGQTRLEGASLERAANWLGLRLPNAAPLGGFMLSGQLAGSPNSIALNAASLSIGAATAVGALKVAFKAGRPQVSADLKVSQLDVDRLSAGLAGSSGPVSSNPVSPNQTSPNTVPGRERETRRPESIEDLIRRSNTNSKGGAGRFAPQVRGYTNRNEWSDEPFDVNQMRLFDAKARLRMDGLKVAGLAIGRATIRFALANGIARADIDDLQLYEGKGQGVITARPTAKGLGFGANLQVSQIQVRQLLGDASGFDRMEGKGNLKALISGAGNTQREIANNINGNAEIDFKDGAVIGWDLAKIMDGLKVGRIPSSDVKPSEKTAFSELAASFKIANGNAVTQDLRLISPHLRVNGNGNVQIGARTLNIAMQPRLITSWQQPGQQSGQGTGNASAQNQGLAVPIKLKGPWHDPRIVLDTGEFAKNPELLVEQAKKLGRRFKGKNLGEIVRGVLGDDENGEAKKPKDILKNLFGR